MKWVLLLIPITIVLTILVLLSINNPEQVMTFNGIRKDKLDTHIPLVIQNQSGFPEDDVFIAVVDADNLIDLKRTSTNMYIPMNKSNYEAELLTYHLKNTDVCEPMGMNEYMVYVPKTLSGKLYISYKSPLVFGINIEGKKAEPAPIASTDLSYSTTYGFMEYTYDANSTLFANVSAVDMMGLPMHLSLVQDNISMASSGLYLPRSYIIAHARERFKDTVWENLFQKTTDTELDECSRIVSPKLHLSEPENTDTFIGWSTFLKDEHAAIIFNVHCGNSVPQFDIYPSTWKCEVNNKQMVINCTDSVHYYTNKSYTVDISHYNEYRVLGAETIHVDWLDDLSEQDEFVLKWKKNWANAPINQCFKALSQNVQIGHYPPRGDDRVITASSHEYYKPIKDEYYTGDMYDLYSRTIHECAGIDGGVYTYAYDEPLFPNVLGAAKNWQSDTSSYMTLYLGYAKKIPGVYEITETLPTWDTFEPTTSNHFHIPSFTTVNNHFSRPPMVSNAIATKKN